MKRMGTWRLVGGLLAAWLVAGSVEAASYTWSGGSSGTWNTDSNNWSGATTTPLWDPANGTNNVALFNANADTATVSGTVYANGVTFNSPFTNALITAGTLTLGGLTPTISYGVVTASVSSIISATPAVTISGSSGGRLELGGNNSFSGGVSFSGGYIVMNNNNALGYRTPVVVKDSATVSINGKAPQISSLTLSNGNCGVANSGNLYFYNANPVITSDGNSSMKPSQILNNYGVDVNFNFVVNSGTNEVFFNNNFLAGYSSLTKSGNGMMMIQVGNSAGTRYTNALTINGGIFSVERLYDANTTGTGLGSSVNDATNLVLNGGTLQFTGGNNNDAAGKVRNKTDRLFSVGTSGGTLDASGSAPVNFYNTGAMGFNSQTGARSLTLTGSNTGTNTLAAAIGDNSGATAVVKGGAGTWVLTGNNSYSGTTVVSNGVLKLGNAYAITNTGAISVAGGTLDLGGFTVTNGAVTLSSGSISNGTMRAGALDISGTGFIDISATLTVSNSLTKSGSGTAELYDNYGYTGSTYVNAGTLNLAPVPSVMTGCVAWFDAGDASTLTTNATGIVTNWANKGSAGATLDAVLQQAGSGPTVLANDLNGKSVLSVSVNGLQTRNNIGISGGQDRTMFLVGCRTIGDNFYMGGMGVWAINKAFFGIRSGTGGISYALYGNDINLPTAQPAGLYEIYDFSLASSNGVACLISNGVFFTQSTALQPSTTDTPLYLGSITNYNNSGKLAEVIVFNRALTEQERRTVEKYLYNKWFSSTPVLPATTTLALASGATLNLGGNSTTVAELSGSGSVSNGALTVTSSINLTNGATANLLVHSNLTVATGTTLNYDFTSSTSDVVNVTGMLTLQGSSHTVTLNPIGAARPPSRITLFTFGSLVGDPTTWTVQGTNLQGYQTSVRTDANSVYVNFGAVGSSISIY